MSETTDLKAWMLTKYKQALGEGVEIGRIAERERIIELLTTMIGWYSALPSLDPNAAVSSALTEVIDRINKGENK